MEQISQAFLTFIDSWGYFAVAVLMAMENACIPVPSELILGFAGYLVSAERMTFTGAMTAGMIGGMVGSIFAYVVGATGGSLTSTLRKIGLTATEFARCSSAACSPSSARSFRCPPVSRA